MWRRLTGHGDLPLGARPEPDERVLASADLADGRTLVLTSYGMWLPDESAAPARRIGWHLISKATWRDGTLVLVEADEVEWFGGEPAAGGAGTTPPGPEPVAGDDRATPSVGAAESHRTGVAAEPFRVGESMGSAPPVPGAPVAVLLADRAARRLVLASPGRVPAVVRERVDGSIRSRHHRDLPGGGAWIVQRKVPGRGGTVLQVRPDPGTDPVAVRRLAAGVVATLTAAGPAARDREASPEI